jgi:GR25 family glycosyltransferase involved in LPS biosynthesis
MTSGDAPLSYTGVYINLDRSTERRAAMEAQISRFGLQDVYRRLPAAEGNSLGVPTKLTHAETGCLLSHYLACKQYAGDGTHLHIVEDDVQFSSITRDAILNTIAGSIMDEHDVLFLDTELSKFVEMRRAMEIYDGAIVLNANGSLRRATLSLRTYHAASTSYLINCRSIPKLVSIYEQLFTNGITKPIDIMVRDMGMAGTLRVGCLFPFVTSVRLDEATTIADREDRSERAALAMNILRHSFFVERDIGKLLELATRAFPANGTNQHLELIKIIAGFYLANRSERM